MDQEEFRDQIQMKTFKTFQQKQGMQAKLMKWNKTAKFKQAIWLLFFALSES